jgi:hypothetical protein
MAKKKKPKPLNNAERQARLRERRRILAKSNDFVLLREAIHVIQKEMDAEDVLVRLLDWLLTYWATTPFETKVRLGKARTSKEIAKLLPRPPGVT